MKKALVALTVIASVLASFAAGCSRDAGPERPNVVFIVIDALRKDHLGSYGYVRETSPFIDSMARHGLIFENAVSQAPWTKASVGSYMTSKYPSTLQLWRTTGDDGKGYQELLLPQEAVTLAEVMKQNGYRTGGVVTNLYASGKFGMAQGFETYEFHNDEPAGETTRRAIDILKKFEKGAGWFGGGKEPFFLYVHYMDVHVPTRPPAPYDTMYQTSDHARHEARHYGWDYYNGENLDSVDFGSYKSHKTALYDGALKYVDDQVRRLAGYLALTGRRNNTIYVITADHGEEMWDHAMFEKQRMEPLLVNHVEKKKIGVDHGHTMFPELLGVPLIIHGMGVPEGRVNQRVRLIDVMPTIMGLAGISGLGTDIDGVDLIAGLRDKSLGDLPGYGEDVSADIVKKSIEEDGYKYVTYYNYFNGERAEFLFDKHFDPGENVDLAGSLPEVRGRYRERLESFTREFEAIKTGAAGPVKLDEKTKEQLKALGYVQ